MDRPIIDNGSMKFLFQMAFILIATSLSAACAYLGNIDRNRLTQSAQQTLQAATLNDADVRALSSKACAQKDSESKIAAPNSDYARRLNRVATLLGNEINGVPVNYKVYLTNDVNAWAMADSCVRVYSGLMDLMNDDELRGIVGHEMGHVALGHTKKAMQVAYAASVARAIASSAGGIARSLSESELGALSKKLVNAQFSQAQERVADDYSFDLQKRKGLDPSALVSVFEKVGRVNGGQSSMLNSHPSSSDRVRHIRVRLQSAQRVPNIKERNGGML